jgi:hypothetical protein
LLLATSETRLFDIFSTTKAKMSFDSHLDSKLKSLEALDNFRELNLQELSEFLLHLFREHSNFRGTKRRVDCKNLPLGQKNKRSCIQ